MGFLTRFFGSKKSVTRDVMRDTEQMTALWKGYRASYDTVLTDILRINYPRASPEKIKKLTNAIRYVHDQLLEKGS